MLRLLLSSAFSTIRQPTKSIITILPRAESQLKRLYEGKDQLLKLSLKRKGCSGLSYSLDFTSSQPSKFDEIVEQNGIKLIVDSKAVMSVLGTEMDYTSSELSSQFTFNNPNVKEMCGCGQSFSV